LSVPVGVKMLKSAYTFRMHIKGPEKKSKIRRIWRRLLLNLGIITTKREKTKRRGG